MGGPFIFILITGIVLFFPFFLETNIHYDLNRQKFGFEFLLFGVLKVFGGYIGTYKGGFALHVSPKKAVLLPYAQMDNERKRFSFMKTFRLISLRVTTETGAEYMLLISALQTILRTYLLANGRKHRNVENNFWLTDGDTLRVSAVSVLHFNIFMLLKVFLKYIRGKIEALWQKKTRKLTS